MNIPTVLNATVQQFWYNIIIVKKKILMHQKSLVIMYQ